MSNHTNTGNSKNLSGNHLSIDNLLGKRPIENSRYTSADTISVISSAIAFLLFLIFNPFLALYIFSIYILLSRVNSKHISKYILFILILAFSIYYSSRNVGVVWSGGDGADDVPYYVQLYQDDLNSNLSSIIDRFLLSPQNYEVLYYSIWWIIGKLFNVGPQTFIFLVYFSQLALLGTVAYLVSVRYATIFIFIYFFGIGDPNPHILHIWRANFGLLVFFTGILIYFKENPVAGRIIVYASAGFHLSMLLFVFMFECYNLLKERCGFLLAVALGALVGYILGNYFDIAMQSIIPAKLETFFNEQNYDPKRNFTQTFILIILLVSIYHYKLSAVARFITFTFSTYFFFQIAVDQYTTFTTRLNWIIVPLITVPFFEIIMKQKKMLIILCVCFLYLRKSLGPDIDMYSLMIPEYKDIFYGVINIIVFK